MTSGPSKARAMDKRWFDSEDFNEFHDRMNVWFLTGGWKEVLADQIQPPWQYIEADVDGEPPIDGYPPVFPDAIVRGRLKGKHEEAMKPVIVRWDPENPDSHWNRCSDCKNSRRCIGYDPIDLTTLDKEKSVKAAVVVLCVSCNRTEKATVFAFPSFNDWAEKKYPSPHWSSYDEEYEVYQTAKAKREKHIPDYRKEYFTERSRAIEQFVADWSEPQMWKDVCTGPEVSAVIDVKTRVSFGSDLRQMNLYRIRTGIRLLYIVTPDGRYDDAFKGQGINVFHPPVVDEVERKAEEMAAKLRERLP